MIIKPYYAMRLVIKFLWELVLSNLQVARIVLSPTISIRPGIVAYTTQLRSDLGVTMLANLITLTPGTLTLEVSEDRSTLFVHTLNIGDPEEVVRSIREAFEKELAVLER
ncbi:MAG: Na+/H+ antiporter subunit E [Candidatus Binatia bacterium]